MRKIVLGLGLATALVLGTPGTAAADTPAVCDTALGEQCETTVRPAARIAFESAFAVTNEHTSITVTLPVTGDTYSYSFTCTLMGEGPNGGDLYACEDSDGDMWMWEL